MKGLDHRLMSPPKVADWPATSRICMIRLKSAKPESRKLRILSVPPLHIQLRQGLGDRGVGRSHFFITQLLGEAGFGALACFLGLRLVNALSLDRHVGQ